MSKADPDPTENLKYFVSKILLEDGAFHSVCVFAAPHIAAATNSFRQIFPQYHGILTAISEISQTEYEWLRNDPTRAPAHCCPVCGSPCTVIGEDDKMIAVCRRCGNESGLKEATR